ncbi:MAG: response regulator [Deltaproteobacteria bacterium]|nr:response regulator [Deltaproteobacteria bacterium]
MTEDVPVVLFVDDEKHVVESLRDALRRMPFLILTATSGDGALKILQATKVDVVVSDERMPIMSGTELLAKVRELYPDSVRIVLTGHATLEAAVRAINEGEVYRFLAKPCRAMDLAQTIQEGLRLKRLARGSRALLQRTLSREGQAGDSTATSVEPTEVDSRQDDSIFIEETNESVSELIQEIEEYLRR